MNYKKIINIILRCVTYVYIVSRLINVCLESNYIFTIGAIKVLLDLIFLDIVSTWTSLFSEVNINDLAEVLMCLNLLFFPYFYAKLCGLYKLFKTHKLWQRNLIFFLITLLIFPVAMFDFKNFKVFNNFFYENNQITIIATMFSTMLAFYLNLFFEFLTKKFPKPFEKIGYWCSIEFYKDLIKKKN